MARHPGLSDDPIAQEKLVEYIWDNFSGSTYQKSFDDFDRERFFGIIEHLTELRETVTKFAPEWPLRKIASHDRAILYTGLYELRYTDVPAAVVIDEAVELGKEFGGDRSSKFVNGVLSSYHKSITVKA